MCIYGILLSRSPSERRLTTAKIPVLRKWFTNRRRTDRFILYFCGTKQRDIARGATAQRKQIDLTEPLCYDQLYTRKHNSISHICDGLLGFMFPTPKFGHLQNIEMAQQIQRSNNRNICFVFTLLCCVCDDSHNIS